MKVYPVSKREDNKKNDFFQDPDSKLDLNHFFRDSHLHVDGYEEDMNGCLLLYTRSSKPHGVCPYCQSVSRKVHSRYMRRLQELTDYECEVTNALFGVEWFDQLLEAAGSFLKCLRSNNPVRLERWLDKYEKSTLPRISTFVSGIRMDIKAVKNAMIYHASNGITEGFVNKLKTIKRVMYGKAKLPLLKIKMVMPTWIFN